MRGLPTSRRAASAWRSSAGNPLIDARSPAAVRAEQLGRDAGHHGAIEQRVADAGRRVGEVLHDPPRRRRRGATTSTAYVVSHRTAAARRRRRGGSAATTPAPRPAPSRSRDGLRGARRGRRAAPRAPTMRSATAAGQLGEHLAVEHERASGRAATAGSRRPASRRRRAGRGRGDRRAMPRSADRPRPGARVSAQVVVEELRRSSSVAVASPRRVGRSGRRRTSASRRPDLQVAVGDPLVELGDGDLQLVHRLVERRARRCSRSIESRSTASTWSTASSGPSGSGSSTSARRDLVEAGPARPAGSGRARAGSARPTCPRSARGPPAGTSAGPTPSAARPSTAPRRGRFSRSPSPGCDSTRGGAHAEHTGRHVGPFDAPARGATSRTPRRGSSPSPARRRCDDRRR